MLLLIVLRITLEVIVLQIDNQIEELLPRRFVIWISKKVIVGEENLVKQVKRTVNFIHLPH
ncbi:unnamed protein product, partial [Vitis vinifera]